MVFQFIMLQVLVFGAVIFIMKKILTNDTQAAVGRLDTAYQDLLKKQKELTTKIEEAEKEYAEKKEQAGQITRKMKNEATEEIRNQKEETLKATKLAADEILGRAHAAADTFRHEVEVQVARKWIAKTLDVLGRSFDETTVKQLHDTMVEDFARRGKDFDLSGVGAHVTELTIYAALPLVEDQRKLLREMVAEKLGRELEFKEEAKPELIAGVCLAFGTLEVDGSLSSGVREITAADKERAALVGMHENTPEERAREREEKAKAELEGGEVAEAKVVDADKKEEGPTGKPEAKKTA